MDESPATAAGAGMFISWGAAAAAANGHLVVIGLWSLRAPSKI